MKRVIVVALLLFTGLVNAITLQDFAYEWLSEDSYCDFNEDGIVDYFDLVVYRELPLMTIKYLDGDLVTGANDGSSPADAWQSVADAISGYANGDDIMVSGGTYTLLADAQWFRRDFSLTPIDGDVIFDGDNSFKTLVKNSSGAEGTAIIGDISNVYKTKFINGDDQAILFQTGTHKTDATLYNCEANDSGNNGFTCQFAGNIDIAVTLNDCLSSGNNNDGYSILARVSGLNNDCDLTLNNCRSVNNGTDVNSQAITTHANAGTGIDTVIVTGGGDYEAYGDGINIGGKTDFTASDVNFVGINDNGLVTAADHVGTIKLTNVSIQSGGAELQFNSGANTITDFDNVLFGAEFPAPSFSRHSLTRNF